MALMKVSDAANNIINLVGATEGVMQAFPATNADGTLNTAAQATAIGQMVDALVNNGLFLLPPGANTTQVKAFAQTVAGVIQTYLTTTKKTEL